MVQPQATGTDDGYEQDFFGSAVGLDGITDDCAVLLRSALKA